MSFSVNYSAAEQVMREINFTSRVSVRYDAEACVTRIMRETWQVCLSVLIFEREENWSTQRKTLKVQERSTTTTQLT